MTAPAGTFMMRVYWARFEFAVCRSGLIAEGRHVEANLGNAGPLSGTSSTDPVRISLIQRRDRLVVFAESYLNKGDKERRYVVVLRPLL